ncbi:MAG TPA: GNAT family N-acetyltransferase [Fimbriimonadaceae bacterium]|nr:GNAT family N-acetyltransferase [Fimbriimonadaceae bacterium]
MLRANRVIQAIERNPDALWRLMASRTPSAAYEVVHGVALTSLNQPHYLFNFASMASLESGTEEQAIAGAASFFESRGMPWCWQVGPASNPDDLGDKLVAAGLTLSHQTPGMGVDLRGYEPGSVEEVQEVTDEASLAEWSEAVLAAFGMPPAFGSVFTNCFAPDVPIRFFYLKADGKPVAASMSFYGAGVAGIYCVGVVPEARRRGFGERVMHACLQGALEDGYDVAILHSSRMGVPLYEKLGFREYCKIAFYMPAGQDD